MPTFTGSVSLAGNGVLSVGSLQRMRIVTPERLDGLVANLVNDSSTSTGLAVANHAGTGGGSTTGVTSPTANTLMGRDGNGRSQVSDPSASSDIATLGWTNTKLAGYLPTSQKGAASGLATLDSTTHVPSGQISSVFPRNLGSGTTFPASPNVMDYYTHTGLGCAFRWDGTYWQQAGRATCATRAARDTIKTNWSSVIPQGYTVVQTNYRWKWRWDEGNDWVFAGFDGAASWNPSNTVNLGPNFEWSSLNNSAPPNANLQVLGFSYNNHFGTADTPREIVTCDGTVFTVHDRCLLNVGFLISSDFSNVGTSNAWIGWSGSSTSYAQDERHRDSGYTTAGALVQAASQLRYVNAGETFALYLNQQNPNGLAITYQFYINVTLIPA